MKNEMIKDMQKIRGILTFFDYNDKNLTDEQRGAIEEIKDIVYKEIYDENE